jgi:general secretion pathway protein G
MTLTRPSRRGFTLVEILIVVVILGILAAIAVPKFSNASVVARESALKEDLRMLRTQVGIYRANHNDVPPGYPGGDTTQAPDATDFINQLTMFTDAVGNVSATQTGAYTYGVYVNPMPPNPMTGLSTVKVLGPSDSTTPDGTTGWIYQPSTNIVLANLVGTDSSGMSYSTY